jgi:hypothetical protein
LRCGVGGHNQVKLATTEARFDESEGSLNYSSWASGRAS